MEDETRATLGRLNPLVGQWTIEAVFPQLPPSDVRGRVVFAWGPGDAFLIQRWEVPLPEAPDGVAIVAVDEDSRTLVQYYFDSRGVVREYEMGFEGGIWTLLRYAPGFSQRFRGELDAGGETIEGGWEKSDDGANWEHDFDLVYRKVG